MSVLELDSSDADYDTRVVVECTPRDLREGESCSRVFFLIGDEVIGARIIYSLCRSVLDIEEDVYLGHKVLGYMHADGSRGDTPYCGTRPILQDSFGREIVEEGSIISIG